MERPIPRLFACATSEEQQTTGSGLPLGDGVSSPVATDSEARGAVRGEDGHEDGEA
jgi:hypothetical protein